MHKNVNDSGSVAYKQWADALSVYLFSTFVEDLIIEACADCAWEQLLTIPKIDHFYLDDAPIQGGDDSVSPLGSRIPIYTGNTIGGTTAGNLGVGGGGGKHHGGASAAVACPICQEQVGGQRFAPHLERCMNGGKRGSRKYAEIMLEDSYQSKAGKVKVTDLYPNSLVVKIKVKNFGEITLVCVAVLSLLPVSKHVILIVSGWGCSSKGISKEERGDYGGVSAGRARSDPFLHHCCAATPSLFHCSLHSF